MNSIIYIYIFENKNFHISNKQKGGVYYKLIEYVYRSNHLYSKIKKLSLLYPEKTINWTINNAFYKSLLKNFTLQNAKDIYNYYFQNYIQLKLF